MLFISNVKVCTLIFCKKNINKAKIGKQWQAMASKKNTQHYEICEYQFDRKSARFVDQLFFQELRKPFCLLPLLWRGREGSREGGYSVYTAPAHCTELWCGTAVFQECYECKVAKFCSKTTIFLTNLKLNPKSSAFNLESRNV